MATAQMVTVTTGPMRAIPPMMAATTAESGVATLDRIGVVQILRRNRTLFDEGAPADHYYKVTSGAVRMVKLLPDGRRHVVEFALPGDFVGLTMSGCHGFAAEAVVDSTLVRYARRGVEAMMERDPTIGRHFLSIVCKGLSLAQDRQLLLGRRTAVERIARFLLDTAERQAGGDGDVALAMARVDIADHLGLTVETVSRVFTRLRQDGVIALSSPTHVVIRDREALEELADQDVASEAA